MTTKRIVFALVLVFVAFNVGAGDSASKAADDDMDRAYKAARRGYWQEAMAQYEQGLEQTPNDAELINNLAVAQEAVGNYEQAKSLYEKALELDPGDRRIRKNFMLFQEFYATFVIREQEDGNAEAESADANESAESADPDADADADVEQPAATPEDEQSGDDGSDEGEEAVTDEASDE